MSSWSSYSETPASNYVSPYFVVGMAPSLVKVAGSTIMADLATRFANMHTTGGTANAQTITQTQQLSALINGLELIVLPNLTNTGAMTFAPDGLTAKNVFANGVAAIAGMWKQNVPAHIKYDGTQWNLLNPQESTGSGTITQTGYASPPTATINYRILPDGITCYWYVSGANVSGTSNAATMTWTGIPPAMQPAANAQSLNIALEDNGTWTIGAVTISAASSTWTFGKTVNGTGGFTTSGTKATASTYTYSHLLN